MDVDFEFVFPQVMYTLSSTAGGGLYYSHLIAFVINGWLDLDLSAAELLVYGCDVWCEYGPHLLNKLHKFPPVCVAVSTDNLN